MQDLTRCVRHPSVSHEGFASLATPTYRASTIVYDDPESFNRRNERGPSGYSYGLNGTPTTRTLEAQITDLHLGAGTVLVPSGLAAVTFVFLACLKPGDRVLIPDTVYPPVRHVCATYLAARGIDVMAYDPLIGARIDQLIDERTRLVWTESPGSGTMEVQDVPAIVDAAKRRGALVGCDNTWATPLLFKPLQHRVDFVSEALTKYVGGHSDLLMGSITVADDQLRQSLLGVVRGLGIGVSPDDASLALRGIETMGVRLAHVGRVAEDFARKLHDHACVEQVLHPALSSCPGHDIWKRDFRGASGVFSLILAPCPAERLEDAMARLKVFSIGASWGGTHSLVAPMAIGRERSVRPWPYEGSILRLSIGLEDPADLWDDLTSMLDGLGP